jgi:hypothetical protein
MAGPKVNILEGFLETFWVHLHYGAFLGGSFEA